MLLYEKVAWFLKAIRRRSKRIGDEVPKVPRLDKLVAFSQRMQPAFSQIIERNVASGRWPGNFSFRCTHGFLSSRAGEGFVVTRRNVSKTGLKEADFVWVAMEMDDGKLLYSANEGAKPSIDSPVHRVIYAELPWVRFVVHGHLQARGEGVCPKQLPRWPCGAENEARDVVGVAPKDDTDLWVANVEGHGFLALLGEDDPEAALEKLANLDFEAN